MKRVIGYFAVTNGALKRDTVVISQEFILDDQGVVVNSRKHLTLGSEDGEQVFRSEDPSLFTLADGTILRKSGPVLTDDC